MKLNFFNSESPFFQFRWLIIIVIAIGSLMLWHDLFGGRMFSFRNQQQWSSSGPGYHK